MSFSRALRWSAALVLLLLSTHCGEREGSEMSTRVEPGRTIAPAGLEPFEPDMARELLDGIDAQGPDYRPRTHHFNADGTPKYTNRLILESSPYLLQHAHNPVNWFPWGDEAFEQARIHGKPVLLSVGYATCHWCHVMEEESFEDEEIASIMNEHYVAIKVDREQRPDIDAVYMAAVQQLTGSGGWPMTVWLTADRKPFYGGTYFPPRTGVRGARIGFDRLLLVLAERFHSQPDAVLSAASGLTESLRAALTPPSGEGAPSATVLRNAYDVYRQTFDDQFGGFGGSPKFPRSVSLEFLLRFYRRSGESNARHMVELTLERMARGGMYDQIGGGFHRYSTDRTWLVPHFEKMLYDNALLTVAYLEGHQATGREDFADVARDILRYVRREMIAPEGGFHSATDADSEGEEGTFFVWTPAQLEAVLGLDRAPVLAAYYGVTEQGNFEGASILHRPRPHEEVAGEFGLEPARLLHLVATAREELYRERARREPPLTDRKILVSWNGLMISAYARAAVMLPDARANEREYLGIAIRAAEFILSTMRVGPRLRRSAFRGQVSGDGLLDDYAFFAAGLLDLYEATGDPRWLEEAIALHRVLEEHFWDAGQGAYFSTPNDGEVLLAREKPDYDGAEPSGNSVAVLNLLRLHELTTDDRYREMAVSAFRALGSTLSRAPTSAPKLLSALDFYSDTAKAIVIVRPDSETGADALLDTLGQRFVPNHVLAVVSTGDHQRRVRTIVPLVGDKTAQNGRATAYVCENRVCALPTSDPKVFARQLATHAPLPAS